MRISGCLIVVIALTAPAALAADGVTARTLLDQAIRAHGGEAELEKYPAVTVKTEGIFQGHERTPVFFHTCEATTHGADQYRVSLSGKLQKQAFQIINVLDGDRGWIKQGDKTIADTSLCTPVQLADFREQGYLNWITTLVPLKSSDFTLTLAGEQTRHAATLVGIRVSREGHRDVTLFFDKVTHLLVKIDERGTAGTGVDGHVETIRGKYQRVKGLHLPSSWEVFYNGKCLWSHHVTEYGLAEKPAPGTFDEP